MKVHVHIFPKDFFEGCTPYWYCVHLLQTKVYNAKVHRPYNAVKTNYSSL